MYYIDSVEFTEGLGLKFDKFMDAFTVQQKNYWNLKIFTNIYENSTKHLLKVWDPYWEKITFYEHDPVCLPTPKK